jgi:hypothetical protein
MIARDTIDGDARYRDLLTTGDLEQRRVDEFVSAPWRERKLSFARSGGLTIARPRRTHV